MKLLTSSTATALWHGIIQEAEAKCRSCLNQELESYLVFLLMRYTQKPEFVKHIMASELLQGLKFSASQRFIALQEVGDKCLLFSGLFPQVAEKRLVKISYFVGIGKIAYATISDDLFQSLSKDFVRLMDILQSIHHYTNEYPDLLPIQAYDLWNETQSQRALSVLNQYTHAK